MKLLEKLKFTILCIGLMACGNYVEAEKKEDPELYYYDDVDDETDEEIEELQKSIEALESEPDEPESEFLWTLKEMKDEQYFCEDEYWAKIDNADRFCSCRTEMISVRWTWEDYKHHPFSYIEHLDSAGRLERCTDPEKILEPDVPEAIIEDQSFVPEPIP